MVAEAYGPVLEGAGSGCVGKICPLVGGTGRGAFGSRDGSRSSTSSGASKGRGSMEGEAPDEAFPEEEEFCAGACHIGMSEPFGAAAPGDDSRSKTTSATARAGNMSAPLHTPTTPLIPFSPHLETVERIKQRRGFIY